MANNIGMTEKEKRPAFNRGLSPKLKSQLITHNPQSLAETIERIYFSETALNLQNQETVNAVDSITTCQLAGLNDAVARLDAKINTTADNSKPEQKTAPPVYYKQRDQQQCFQQPPTPYGVHLTNQQTGTDHLKISRTSINNNSDLY